MRAFCGWLSLFALAGSLAGCSGSDCETDGCESETETEDSVIESDTDDEFEANRLFYITYEWETTDRTSDLAIRVVCDGDVKEERSNHTADKEYSYRVKVEEGESCHFEMADARGGWLPAGRVRTCDIVAAEWEAQRATGSGIETIVGQVTAVECIRGCMDSLAENYDPEANFDDQTCEYVEGCTEPLADNYDPDATREDGSCLYSGFADMEIIYETDNRPTESKVHLTCDGNDMVLKNYGSMTRHWDRQTEIITVSAGMQCSLTLGDAFGDHGVRARLHVCGEPVQAGSPLGVFRPNDFTEFGSPWEVNVANFQVLGCSGCIDEDALNYDPDARLSDGSCVYF